MSAAEWRRGHSQALGAEVMHPIMSLFSATASSAGVERVFSSFGLVHSKLCNWLGTENAGKLVFLFRALNSKFDVDDEDDDDAPFGSPAV